MKVQIRDRDGVRISKILHAQVVSLLGLALGRFGQRIERVLVRFSAVAGEQRCHIEVGLRGPLVRAEGLHDDRLAAADHAVARAASSVSRALEREALSSPSAFKP